MAKKKPKQSVSAAPVRPRKKQPVSAKPVRRRKNPSIAAEQPVVVEQPVSDEQPVSVEEPVSTEPVRPKKKLRAGKKKVKKPVVERIHPPMRPVPQQLIDELQSWLMETYAMKRPPVVAAGVLAFILVLHEKGEAFPMREDVAWHLGCTAWGIDAALSLALAREMLTIEIETIESTAIEQRRGVNRYRHYVPSAELLHRFSIHPRRRVA